MYLHTYLHFCQLNFHLFFVFARNPVFGGFLGLLKPFLLVYTNILEQKRIAGQGENSFILILFEKSFILLFKP